MARTQQQFSTIRTEGALLPPDVLQQIAAGKAEGLRAADYHLPEGYKLNEAITQSWDILKKHWKAFQEARTRLADTDTGTEITNKHWLLPLFRELAYGHLPTQPAPVIDERSYPIERLYNHTPIHLVGCNLPLDRRTKGARGAATASPHSMVQEYLNRSTDHLWAIVSNGRQLRLLRDNVALSRQAFVEFDLEAMMEGEVYPDFALLWLLLHQSRVEAPKADDCWLENWSKLARESGTRILKQLRESVRTAIEALGQGFIAHVRNESLREQLRCGSLSRDDYYRQLLRIVYRLLFLFVAEDRQLLHPPTASEQARDRYRRFYSLSRLRDMALKLRGSKHGDLWHALSLVFAGLGNPEGCPTLGLVGLGSFLWTPDKTPDLNGPHEAAAGRTPVEIANDDLLTAVRALAYVEQDNVLRSVDYRNLGSEELGSVYESLLELHPDIDLTASRFTLDKAAGNERKKSGSYYTPDSLVQCLLDSALDPVVEDRLKGKKGDDAQRAILDLTVCDPACGSGHFLIAAAHRLARHLARIRTGETEPSPEDHQTALRDVICRCIYGVDLNPMAVELCKVSLWMEAIEPGKPLSFLDHHIKCGNSLLGVTPRLLHEGIPKEAFKLIEGDDRAIVTALRQRHASELRDRTGGRQKYLFEPYLKLGNLAEEFVRVTTDPTDTAVDIARKAKLYADLVEGADYRNAKLLADTWCSAFAWKKDTTDLGRACPTERDFRECETNPHSLLPHVRDEVARLANEFSFFHWHLAFPEVFTVPKAGHRPENEQMGWSGGFGVMLGNPPWDRLKLDVTEWFAERAPEIANEGNADARTNMIEALAADSPALYAEYKTALRHFESTSLLLRDAGHLPLGTQGEADLSTAFADLVARLIAQQGRAGVVVSGTSVTGKSSVPLLNAWLAGDQLNSLWEFINTQKLFDIDSRQRFALVTLTTKGESDRTAVAFDLTQAAGIPRGAEALTYSDEEIALLSPNTKQFPKIGDLTTKEILVHFAKAGVPLQTPDADLFGFRTAFVFEEAKSRQHLSDTPGASRLAVLEGKSFHVFDHRFATFDGCSREAIQAKSPRTTKVGEHADPNYSTQRMPRLFADAAETTARLSRFGTDGYLFASREVTNATNERTVICAALPPTAVLHSSWIFRFAKLDAIDSAWLLANFNAYAFDFTARQKVTTSHLSKYVWTQLPVIAPGSAPRWMRPEVARRVVELSYCASELASFAKALGYVGRPFRWTPLRRLEIRCELDALFFHLYLDHGRPWSDATAPLRKAFPQSRDVVAHVMDTFTIKKHDEVTKYGAYRTKERIMAIYDEMAECLAKGTEWKSPLDPPPGDPRATWTEDEIEMWRAGRGKELIEKYGLLDDADNPDDSDPDLDVEVEDPAEAEALD